MFSKALILVLLGATLVLSSPAHSLDDQVVLRSSWKEKINQISNTFQETLEKIYDKLDSTYVVSLEEIRKTISDFVELGKDKYQELKEKYEEIQGKAKAAIEHEKKFWEGRIEKLKEYSTESVAATKEHLEELKEMAEKAIQEQKEKWQAKYEEWKKQVKEAFELAKGQ